MTRSARQKKKATPRTASDDDVAAADDDVVTCIMSGRRVPRAEAIEVRLGTRRKVWMLPEFCRERESRDT